MVNRNCRVSSAFPCHLFLKDPMKMDSKTHWFHSNLKEKSVRGGTIKQSKLLVIITDLAYSIEKVSKKLVTYLI